MTDLRGVEAIEVDGLFCDDFDDVECTKFTMLESTGFVATWTVSESEELVSSVGGRYILPFPLAFTRSLALLDTGIYD